METLHITWLSSSGSVDPAPPVIFLAVLPLNSGPEPSEMASQRQLACSTQCEFWVAWIYLFPLCSPRTLSRSL